MSKIINMDGRGDAKSLRLCTRPRISFQLYTKTVCVYVVTVSGARPAKDVAVQDVSVVERERERGFVVVIFAS